MCVRTSPRYQKSARGCAQRTMSSGPPPIHFRGGRSDRWRDRSDLPSKHARHGPRWSPAAAAATKPALVQLSKDLGLKGHILPMLYKGIDDTALWGEIERAVRKACTVFQFDNAVSVLRFQRDKAAQGSSKAEKSGSLELALDVLNRNVKKCPLRGTLGIAPAATVSPASFMAWVDEESVPPQRPTPAEDTNQGPLNYARAWGLSRVREDILASGVIVFGRAADRVRKWRSDSGAAADAPPPIALLTSLVHTDTLPTALTSRADHYWLTGQRRYMSVPELTRAMGLRATSNLTRALCAIRCPTNAGIHCGNGIHAGVADLVLDWIHARVPLPTTLTYASLRHARALFSSPEHSRRAGPPSDTSMLRNATPPRAMCCATRGGFPRTRCSNPQQLGQVHHRPRKAQRRDRGAVRATARRLRRSLC